MPHHRKPVSKPVSGSAHGASSAGTPGGSQEEAFICRMPAAALARVRPGADQIAVERLERDDGTPIIYLDAADVVAFIYLGQTTDGSPHTDAGAAPVVIDVHRRTDAAQRRLRFLLDNAPARLLASEPARFQVVASTGPPPGRLELICLHCQGRMPAEPAGLLHALVEAAAGHSCHGKPAPAGGNGTESC